MKTTNKMVSMFVYYQIISYFTNSALSNVIHLRKTATYFYRKNKKVMILANISAYQIFKTGVLKCQKIVFSLKTKAKNLWDKICPKCEKLTRFGCFMADLLDSRHGCSIPY